MAKAVMTSMVATSVHTNVLVRRGARQVANKSAAITLTDSVKMIGLTTCPLELNKALR